MSEVPLDASSRLKASRKRAGYGSAAKAARALNIPEVSYRSHETGGRAFDEDAARKYGEAFGVNWAWLITGQGDQGTTRKLTQDDSEMFDAALFKSIRIVDRGRLLEGGDVELSIHRTVTFDQASRILAILKEGK